MQSCYDSYVKNLWPFYERLVYDVREVDGIYHTDTVLHINMICIMHDIRIIKL